MRSKADLHPFYGVRNVEKDVHRTDRNIPLFAGEDIAHPDPDSPFAESGTNVHLEQMKDMLLTYNEYNKELGYVQGMSDLLAPIYAVMQDDAVAFWGFVGFMGRMVPAAQFPRLSPTSTEHRANLILGAKFPTRPIWNAYSTPDTRPPRSTRRPKALYPPPKSRVYQFFLFLPHAARVV